MHNQSLVFLQTNGYSILRDTRSYWAYTQFLFGCSYQAAARYSSIGPITHQFHQSMNAIFPAILSQHLRFCCSVTLLVSCRLSSGTLPSGPFKASARASASHAWWQCQSASSVQSSRCLRSVRRLSGSLRS
jgi:hypothetical protein